jgi:hypothetical protein
MVRKDHEVTVHHRGRKLSEEYKTYVTATTDEFFDAGWSSGDQEGIARLLDQGWVVDTW